MPLVDYFLSSSASVVQLELLEISHPQFSRVYRVVRNAVNGVVVTLEDDTIVKFEYYPLRIQYKGDRDNLDSSFQIDLGDLGEVLPRELDSVFSASAFNVKPVVKYRTYRSDDLSAPLLGPLVLEIQTFAFNREGATFEARAPQLNVSRTGEQYKLDRFPMLRGFL